MSSSNDGQPQPRPRPQLDMSDFAGRGVDSPQQEVKKAFHALQDADANTDGLDAPEMLTALARLREPEVPAEQSAISLRLHARYDGDGDGRLDQAQMQRLAQAEAIEHAERWEPFWQRQLADQCIMMRTHAS